MSVNITRPPYPAGVNQINVGLTLVHRVRRWTNVKSTLIQRLLAEWVSL